MSLIKCANCYQKIRPISDDYYVIKMALVHQGELYWHSISNLCASCAKQALETEEKENNVK